MADDGDIMTDNELTKMTVGEAVAALEALTTYPARSRPLTTNHHREETMTNRTRTRNELRTDVLNATTWHLQAEQLLSVLNEARHKNPSNEFITAAHERAEQLCAETAEDMTKALLTAHNHGIDIG